MEALGGRAIGPAGPPLGTALAVSALAALLGLAYAVSAYAIGPAVLPVAVLAIAAALLGVFRLEYGVALLVVLTPFAENAAVSDPAAAPMRVGLSLWLVVLALIELGRQLVSSDRLRAPALLGAAIGLLLVALVGVALASDLQDAAATCLAMVGSVSLYVLIAIRLQDWHRLKPVLAAIVIVGLAISVHSIWQYVTGQFTELGSFLTAQGELEERIASTFSHPNQLGGFLAIMVATGAGLIRVFDGRPARAACLALVVLALVAAVLTFSRGTLIAIGALALLYAGTRRAWPAIVVTLLALVLLAPSAWQDRLAGIGDTENPEIATRLDLWGAGLQMFADQPVTGVGLNSYGASYVEIERTGRTFLGLGSPFDVPENAHNLYVNTLAEQGLLGMAALLALMIAASRLSFSLRGSGDVRARAIGTTLLGVLTVIFVQNLFDLTLFDPKTSVFVWTMLGVGAAVAGMERSRGTA